MRRSVDEAHALGGDRRLHPGRACSRRRGRLVHLRLLGGDGGELGDDLGGALARHDDDAVLVADEDVARMRPPARRSTTARPISPGPSLNGELGERPRAKTGMPTASMPSTSRTMPSVTQATTPLLLRHAEPGRRRRPRPARSRRSR